MHDPTLAPPGKYVEVPVTVRFGDTDPYGVVYFASYFRYCHHGIEEFFKQVGLQPRDLFRNQEEGFGLPVVGASCDFLKPIWYGDPLRMAVFVIHAKSKSLTFGFHFYHGENQGLVAKGQATIVAIDRNWQSRNMPARLKEALVPYLPPVQES